MGNRTRMRGTTCFRARCVGGARAYRPGNAGRGAGAYRGLFPFRAGTPRRLRQPPPRPCTKTAALCGPGGPAYCSFSQSVCFVLLLQIMLPQGRGFVKRDPQEKNPGAGGVFPMEKIPAWALLFLLGQSIIKMYAEALPPPGSRCLENSVILLGKTGVLRMEQRVTDFFEMLRTRKVGLVGFGVTNNGIARMLAAKGIHVTIHDRQDRKELGEICQEMEEAGVSLSLGYNYLRTLEEDVIFRAPGVPFDLPELTAARKAGKVITSDLEMFFDLCPCPIIGVTGSDGKTTTTTLIAEMLRAQGKRVHLGGNIGKALFPEIETVCPEDYAVVELSSFQLISLRRSPDIAVVTNVSPNHLDIHGTMKEYVAAKRNILLHQNAFSRTVLNADNDLTRKYIPDVRGCVCTFSRQTNVYRGAWEDSSGTIWYSDNGSQTRIMKAEEIRIPGLHNVENYLAAITAVWGIASLESIRKVAHEFAGVEHRIELVRELDGVKWYNDSIATSPSRTIAGLLSFDQQIIIIAGGYDKKIPYGPLAPVLLDKAKVLILTGATGPKIEAAVTEIPGWEKSGLQILHAENLEEAVKLAREKAQSGDIVSLSPASASFDRYKNFEVRGRHYKDLVMAL